MKIFTFIVFLFLFWLYHYIKFRRRYSYYTAMVYCLSNADGKENVSLRLASALIEIQHFKDAYLIFKNVLDTYPVTNHGSGEVYVFEEYVWRYVGNRYIEQLLPVLYKKSDIEINMRFCQHPIPGVNQAKNYNHSYWLKFLIYRLGYKRSLFLTEDDYIRTDAMLRRRKKQRSAN